MPKLYTGFYFNPNNNSFHITFLESRDPSRAHVDSQEFWKSDKKADKQIKYEHSECKLEKRQEINLRHVIYVNEYFAIILYLVVVSLKVCHWEF